MVGILFSGLAQMQAQNTVTNETDPATWSGLNLVYPKDHIANKKPIPYPSIREADIMWSRVIWRIIDLREKINQPLYYPTKPMGDRMNLVDALLGAVEDGSLQAFKAEIDNSNEFRDPITFEQVISEFDATDQVREVENVQTGLMAMDTISGEIRFDEVQQLMIKELWFFDRKRSVLEVRIIGLCPIRLYYKPDDSNRENLQRKKLFWVKFPDARPVLARKEVFNPWNDAERRSFDEIFYKRFFDSYIVQESNTYNNRMIRDYAIGMETLLEAERIQDMIFQFEHDLWEY